MAMMTTGDMPASLSRCGRLVQRIAGGWPAHADGLLLLNRARAAADDDQAFAAEVRCRRSSSQNTSANARLTGRPSAMMFQLS